MEDHLRWDHWRRLPVGTRRLLQRAIAVTTSSAPPAPPAAEPQTNPPREGARYRAVCDNLTDLPQGDHTEFRAEPDDAGIDFRRRLPWDAARSGYASSTGCPTNSSMHPRSVTAMSKSLAGTQRIAGRVRSQSQLGGYDSGDDNADDNPAPVAQCGVGSQRRSGQESGLARFWRSRGLLRWFIT